MKYLGDFAPDTVVPIWFDTAQLVGTGATLSSATIRVYKRGSTTESSAGISPTYDYDSRTGLNYVEIDLSSDSFYDALDDYAVVLTAGTVDSVSIGPKVLAQFSIQRNAMAMLVLDWTNSAFTALTIPARCVLNALRLLRNKWSISGTTLTVKKEDDSTDAWTGTVTPDAGATPITGNDPT